MGTPRSGMEHEGNQARTIPGTRPLRAGTGDERPGPAPGVRARLASARDAVSEPGEYLVHEEDGELRLVRLEGEWTRIGRSLAADVRFDDPAVSRRHALLARAPDGVRIIDDRSLNGVWVNGERVEWRSLRDGDEIRVGSHVLCFLVVTAAAAEDDERELRSTIGA